ncbi:uncharacterized protein ANIA_10132 [Aspergillus nidulans FGSC A4]|uniref:BHLH transcription factor (Eurofung) n=2 Tax=Aspergillus subgen. Nidulantes TaxID=2720870 RepID=C8VUS5_EMENI|nr:hypothetical protein [Aspergillus nidulans FGSC A4]CBF88567.1 TPA: putative bHLH transcription factor (Eurofung) [Aspergillus nidulans FGSC A4]
MRLVGEERLGIGFIPVQRNSEPCDPPLFCYARYSPPVSRSAGNMPSAQPPHILASSSEPLYSPIAASGSTNAEDRHDRSSSTPTNSSRQGGERDKPRLTEQEKKNNHIASEQKRRAAIREGFDRLTELVPGLEGQGRSESIVLKKTVDFIHAQLQERKNLITEIERRGGRVSDDMRP